MKLLVSYTSPFVRKVRMVVMEKGLENEIEAVQVNPWQSPATLADANPLSQVPTLLLDDGGAIYDSRVICAYLDTLKPEPQLLPADLRERARCMRMEALADGMTDAAVRVRMARVASPGQPDAPEIARIFGKIEAALKSMQRDAADFGEAMTLPKIAFGAALGYLDFRFADMGWRRQVPELAAWYDGFAALSSMQATAPRE